ncbi:MAG: hypothetical protein LLF94_02710 [Chlamydiales bacterium]|nr:hypothetical protein [Chlamydiales bacterium]
MRLLLLFLLLCGSLHAKTSIQADSADYDGKKIRMAGGVRIQHEFGNIACDKGVMLMKEAPEVRLDLDRIMLNGSIELILHDGSVLTAEEADINCKTLEGVFTATEPNKVIYLTRVEEDGQAIPVKTMSRSMRVTMKREQNGSGSQYVIQDVQALGAVNIEYQQEK